MLSDEADHILLRLRQTLFLLQGTRTRPGGPRSRARVALEAVGISVLCAGWVVLLLSGPVRLHVGAGSAEVGR